MTDEVYEKVNKFEAMISDELDVDWNTVTWTQLIAAQSELAHRLVGLLARGLEAAENAQLIMNLYFKRDNRDPYNNDNYCRMYDWIKDVRRTLGKQPNENQKP